MGISRDYTYYYKKHAQDVNLEDILSSQRNKNILQKLRDGDSEFTGLFILDEPMDDVEDEFMVEKKDDLGWLGYFIGESMILKSLLVKCHIMTGSTLIEGICRNQSIESLDIECDIGNYLSFGQMFKNNSRLDSLIFEYGYMKARGAHDFAVSLRQKSHLKCLSFGYMDFSDEDAAVIAKALVAQPQLEELNFEYNEFERNCCAALKTTFLEWGEKSQLKKLDLSGNFIDDEGLTILLEGIGCCRNLTELLLSCNTNISAAGLRSLSSYFQDDTCCLEKLNLNSMQMDDNGAEALAAGLMHCESLKHLNVSRNQIGDTGIASLVSGLTTAANANLERLDLGENRFSTAGIRSLSTLIQSLRSTLKELSLYNIQVDDDGISILAHELTNNTKLQSLDFEIRASSNVSPISKLLCDTSSINNIYLSNHTLQTICRHDEFWRYLDLNRRRQNLEPEYRRVIPMIKILINYPDLAEMEPFYQWKLKFLPMIVAWFQKAFETRVYFGESFSKFRRREVSAVYKFIRGVPQLVVAGYWSQRLKQVRLKKRKLEEEEEQLLERLGGGKRASIGRDRALSTPEL